MWLFILYLICVEVSVGGEVNDIATVKVMEGGVLNLHPGLEDLKGDVQIMWTFESGRENTRVAQMHQGRIYTHYDMRFTGRVQLDQRTGILTIMDIRTNESGLYEALIVISAGITGRRYKVHVYAPVSEPAISSSSSVSVHQSSGKSQETEETCSLVCSVKNDRDVSISWYKGGVMLNQTSNPDLSINLSLALELHYNDPETYSCTAVNPVNNKTVHLHMNEICPRQEGCLDHCGVTEALVRLVLSGLAGIATVGFLIEHLIFCSAQKRTAASVC
uniref:Ig-like domain-containing protein n=1 Tax=Cyprinus carpio TaxID=7962 RepID=A0A8C1K0B9_CYPCA